MPEFPKLDHLTREQAINSILTSIAMEELALSHILNAEGEKIQYALAACPVDLDKILEVNESVSSLIDQIIDLEIILKNKMRRLAKDFPEEFKKHHKPCKPCPPPCKPEKPCEPEKPCKPCPPEKPDKPCKCQCRPACFCRPNFCIRQLFCF
jgi:hypothetical protein